MTLPADFDRDLWPDPITFQGLVGVALSNGGYSDLFRADGFSKSLAELQQIPWAAAKLAKWGRNAIRF